MSGGGEDCPTVEADSQNGRDIQGSKRSIEEVHSANEWERVDLGDTDRKQKFLRLMGATKKEHHGRFVIGDKKTDVDPVAPDTTKPDHSRSGEDEEKMKTELQTQFEEGLQNKLTGAARRHQGLGFHDAESAEETADKKDEESKKEKDKNAEEKSDSKNETDDKAPPVEIKKTPVKLMTFVKSSESS